MNALPFRSVRPLLPRDAHNLRTSWCSEACSSRGCPQPSRGLRPRLAVPHNASDKAGRVRCRSNMEQGSGYVEDFVLPRITTVEDFNKERQWVQRQVSTWLNEEYTPLDIHSDVGTAAAEAYCKLRAQGENEAGAVLLGLSSALLSFNFRETFTSAFEVSNKVMELVMMHGGCEVCCTTPEDKERLQRVSRELEQASL